jgi:hypothetical protein
MKVKNKLLNQAGKAVSNTMTSSNSLTHVNM